MRFSIKQLALSLVVIIAVNAAAFSAAFAQNRTYHQMKRIEKYIAKAELNIPEHVISEIEDVCIAIAELKEAENRQSQEDFADYYNYESVEDFYRLYQFRKEVHQSSDAYVAMLDQKNDLYKQGLDLLEPYVSEADLAPRKPPVPPTNMTVEEEIDFVVGLQTYYFAAEDIHLSLSDVQDLKRLERDMIPVNSRLNRLVRAGRSSVDTPEFKELIQKRREFNRRRSQILEPYSKKYRAKQRAKRMLLDEFSRTFKPPAKETEWSSLPVEHITGMYEPLGIKVSEADIAAINGLMKEHSETLKAYRALRPDASHPPVDKRSGEARKILDREANIERRLLAILEPYDDQLKAAKKKP